MQPSFVIKIWSNEYLSSGKFFAAADNNVVMLLGLTDLNKSKFEPYFKNLGPILANGPNNNVFWPLMKRVSKCGTVIGGVPGGSLPYTLAPCSSITLDRKSTRLNSSHVSISYAVFC